RLTDSDVGQRWLGLVEEVRVGVRVRSEDDLEAARTQLIERVRGWRLRPVDVARLQRRETRGGLRHRVEDQPVKLRGTSPVVRVREDRKSTRLNSSHVKISYAVFCLKK